MMQDALTQFVQLFTLADLAATARVSERLALALGDPGAYQIQFAEELAERNIHAALPAQELRDVALIDALRAEELSWEADWKDSAADMGEGLNDVLARQGRAVRLALPAPPDDYDFGPEQLDDVQDALEALGLALVLFELGSDSFPLGVVAEADAERLRGLARELGFGLMVY